MIVRNARSALNALRVQENRAESGNDPRPRPDRVVCDVEEKRGEDAIPLGLGGKNPLCHVSAAARLGAGVPRRPPLYRQENRESQKRHPRISLDSVGPYLHREHRERGVGASEVGGQSGLEFVHSSHCSHRVHSEYDHRAHLDDELNEISPEHGPHPGTR